MPEKSPSDVESRAEEWGAAGADAAAAAGGDALDDCTTKNAVTTVSGDTGRIETEVYAASATVRQHIEPF